ncbi:MAG: Imidazolonepropionase [Phycisphaerae bacterium]|nr:Imidazolonepropionase [Phycisphaerae bacterium]
MTTIIRNIGALYVVPPGPVAGPQMADAVNIISHAAVVIENEYIAWIGHETDLSTDIHPLADARGSDRRTTNNQRPTTVIDAAGQAVIPALIDCHTHTVFAGTREAEFALRCGGKSYEEIARAGGGIRSTMQAVRSATPEQLVELARPRLQRMLQNGVTCVEIKSGYGLTPDDELKMLEVIARLRVQGAASFSLRGPLDEPHAALPELVSTYLAAHTIPPEYAGQADKYIDLLFSDDILKRVVALGTEYCDVFCESIAFSVEQSRRLLQAAQRHRLQPRIHADQIRQIGASKLAAEIGAISAEHLEQIDDAGMTAMQRAATIAVLLPGCSLFLGVPQTPARRIINAGIPVAIATDFNPGSSMISSLPLVMSIACSQLRMTPLEVLVACTANAAAALHRADRLGAIVVGHQADLLIIDTPSFDRFLYEVGHYPIRQVLQKGRVVAGTESR